MKKIWSVILVVSVLAGAALVTRRVIWASKQSSAAADDKADVRSSGSATSLVQVPAVDSPAVEISQRGPGMRRQPPDALKLPVPRTLDLTHVTAVNFATALGDDPVRIFNYVRDEIAYESYTGCLRGSRGTLLALAGNSLDRASLLASMLQHAGQHVRFAHGTLPEPLARELVTSMWAERPQPATPPIGAASAAAKAALDVLRVGVKRDYALIRDQLKKSNVTISTKSVPSLDSLVKEAQDHYWVQWSKAGTWVDLDPSFVDSSPGTIYAQVTGTSDLLPDVLFHQVEIRVRVEEYTGNQTSNRVILTRKSKSADLSGLDVIVSHQPENWTGPAESLESALAGGITATGRIKPVLVIGGKDWVAGEPFYPESPPTGGMGGVFNALAGIGTRKEAPIATAEWVEFEFIAPDGSKETAVRQAFDLVGKARRAKRLNLTAEEVRAKTGRNTESGNTASAYGLFFTTGRIAASHLSNLAADAERADESAFDVDSFLRHINIVFTVTSDAILERLGRVNRGRVLFYPDSPRVQIADVSAAGRTGRLGLDLRRTAVRAVTNGTHSEDVFLARVFRGVVEGTLERSLIEYVANLSKQEAVAAMSTSRLFERALAEGVPTVLLTRGDSPSEARVGEEPAAWIRDDLEKGYLVLAPQRRIPIANEPRFAWWRVDARSGDTIAVTDEGLYQTTTQYRIFNERNSQNVTVTVRTYLTPEGGPWRYLGQGERAFNSLAAANNFIKQLIEQGAKLVEVFGPNGTTPFGL